MKNQRTHYVTTSDGVTIGATVHGEGPPVVFVQGTAGDGDLDWNRTVEHLRDQFTCHLPSMRGRGLSGDHPDVSPDRLVDLGPACADPTVLRAISAPVMVLVGSDTVPFFAAAARHVADHVPNARIHEIPGTGHAAPLTHPEALAAAITEFFASAQQPA